MDPECVLGLIRNLWKKRIRVSKPVYFIKSYFLSVTYGNFTLEIPDYFGSMHTSLPEFGRLGVVKGRHGCMGGWDVNTLLKVKLMFQCWWVSSAGGRRALNGGAGDQILGQHGWHLLSLSSPIKWDVWIRLSQRSLCALVFSNFGIYVISTGVHVFRLYKFKK